MKYLAMIFARWRSLLLACIAATLAAGCGRSSDLSGESGSGEGKNMEQLQREFVDLRFGMFICYNIMSYGAKWGEANYDISKFDPKNLDCEQWADAAVSAGMKFGLLTTKHHEGFCLWDSAYTDYDVASTPYGEDVVRQYVDAFRKRDLKIGLYYSIWDSTHDVEKGMIDSEKLAFIKGQLRELLTNYGKIDYLVVDGWYWRMGHHEVPYVEIREFIRELQPDCLITDHTHLQAVYHVDIPYFEGPFGAFPEEGNTMPSALGHCSLKGNGWFWSEATPNGMKKGDGLDLIVDKLEMLEDRYCNFMLNCMPNRDGLLDPIYIDLLQQVGERWTPDESRPSLPPQDPVPFYTTPIHSVTASSGESAYLYDAKQDRTDHFHWFSDEGQTQEIVIDLGNVYEGVDALAIVPNHRCKPAPEAALSDGNVLRLEVSSSADGTSYGAATSISFAENAKPRSITLSGTPMRYIKLNLKERIGEAYVIAELAVGGVKEMPRVSAAPVLVSDTPFDKGH